MGKDDGELLVVGFISIILVVGGIAGFMIYLCHDAESMESHEVPSAPKDHKASSAVDLTSISSRKSKPDEPNSFLSRLWYWKWTILSGLTGITSWFFWSNLKSIWKDRFGSKEPRKLGRLPQYNSVKNLDPDTRAKAGAGRSWPELNS